MPHPRPLAKRAWVGLLALLLVSWGLADPALVGQSPEAQPDPPLVDPFRQWQQRGAKIPKNARFAFVDGEQVGLVQQSGQLLLIPLAHFSATDRAWISRQKVQVLRGKVVVVADGDTLHLLDGQQQERRVRLDGIDAPEQGQAFSQRSREALRKGLGNQEVLVAYSAEDRYGRILGHVYHQGKWLNFQQVQQGLAWHYRHFSGDAHLAATQTEATEAGRGLWADPNRLPPWQFRLKVKRQREEQARSPGKADQSTYWLNTASGIRHNATCEHFRKTGQGRVCGAHEGKPCRLCGG